LRLGLKLEFKLTERTSHQSLWRTALVRPTSECPLALAMHGRAKNSKRSPWNTFTAVRSKGLAGQEAAAATRIRTATRTAFSNLIDAAIEEDVSFILIAGDLYDGDWRDYQTHATSRIRRPRAGASPRRSPAGGAFADRPMRPSAPIPKFSGHCADDRIFVVRADGAGNFRCAACRPP
jgi:hypothetical protein